jgi:uncharacterized protein
MDDDTPQLIFPLELSLRVVGRNTPEFPAEIIALAKRYAPDLDENLVVGRLSREGAYISLLLPLIVAGREQYDALYGEIAAHPGVKMVL